MLITYQYIFFIFEGQARAGAAAAMHTAPDNRLRTWVMVVCIAIRCGYATSGRPVGLHRWWLVFQALYFAWMVVGIKNEANSFCQLFANTGQPFSPRGIWRVFFETAKKPTFWDRGGPLVSPGESQTPGKEGWTGPP